MKKLLFIIGLLTCYLTAEGQKYAIGAVSDTGFVRVLSNGRTTALTAAQMATLFGGGTIADNSVTFAKMQDIATDRLIGRDAAGSGDPAEISLDASLAWTGSNSIQRAALTGDITASAGSNTTDIAAGVIVNADINASAGIVLSKLATQAALSVVTNATNATAVPTAVAAANDGEVFRRSGTALAFGTVATAGIADAAITNVKIADVSAAKITSGTVASALGFTSASSGSIRWNYNGGNTSLILDDASSTTSIFSKDGTQYFSASNTLSSIGSGTSKVEFIDGLLRLYDSDASQYIGFQTPSTGSLTSNYTMTLPTSNGSGVLTNNGSGGLTWEAAGTSLPSVITVSELTSDQALSPSGWETANLIRVSGDNGIRQVLNLTATGVSNGEEKVIMNIGAQPLVIAAQTGAIPTSGNVDAPGNIWLPAKESVRIIYDSADSSWRVLAYPRLRGKVIEREETAGSITAADWGAMGFSGTLASVAAGTDNPGCWSIGTTSAGTSTSIYLPKTVTPTRYGDAFMYVGAYVRVPVLSDATNTFTAHVGFATTVTPTTTANHFVGIRYTHGTNSGKWEGYCKGPTSTTATDLGITVSTSANYLLEVYVNKQCNEARFFIDGVYKGAVSSNMPTTTNAAFPLAGLVKSVGAGSNVLYVSSIKSTLVYPN